jgi:hypothetical protein
MREIYDRHPSCSAEISDERERQLVAMERQSRLVTAVGEQREAGEVTDEEAVRAVAKIRFGLEVPSLSFLDNSTESNPHS